MAPRDWRKYKWGYLSHFAQGVAGAALCLTPEPQALAGLCLLGLCVAYQWAGWVKKGDTVARDLMDIGIGFGVGLAGWVGWQIWQVL